MGAEMSELSDFLDSIPVGRRKQRFLELGQAMLNARRPITILETGCMRQSPAGDPPECDGCSTLVWDYVARITEGRCVSIDNSREAINHAQSKVSKWTQLIHGDSVMVILSIEHITRPFDFVYLDSMDFEGTRIERGLSALHHAAELSAAWHLLADGALVAVDDCVGEYAGKHEIVKRFFDSIGIAPLCDDYIHVWQKPQTLPIPLQVECPQMRRLPDELGVLK